MRQLKHRAVREVRIVPCHPRLVELLREHLAEHGTTPDGRLFRGARCVVGRDELAKRRVEAALDAESES